MAQFFFIDLVIDNSETNERMDRYVICMGQTLDTSLKKSILTIHWFKDLPDQDVSVVVLELERSAMELELITISKN